MFEKIFGKDKAESQSQYTQLQMLNGFIPVFTSFSGDAYDSDVVRSAVDAIARNAAKLKPKHIRRVDGTIQNTGSNIEKLLQLRPNPYMDAYTFYYKVITQLFMKNNSFVFVDWDETGNARGFYPINASSVEFLEVKGQPAAGVFVKFRFLGGRMVTLPYEDLIHLRRFFYQNDLYGETSDKALTPTLELINTTNQGIANAVKSSAFLRGLLKFTSMLKREDMNKQRDEFVQDYMNINNNGGIAATDSKAEYVDLKTEPKMVDAKQMDLIEKKVHKYFGINEKIVMSTYNEQEWNAFYESVIEPLAIQMSLEFTAKVFSNREKGRGNEIIYEANRLQYASNQTKLSIVTLLMDRGMMSQNEGLEVFNLPPIEGGDKRILSLNFVDAAKANQYQLGENEDPPANEKDGDDDNDTTEDSSE